MDTVELNKSLLTACKIDDIGKVTELVKSGADVNFRSPFGVPLRIAIQRGNFELCKLLVENGADVNGTCGVRINLYSYAQIAAQDGKTDILAYLLDHGADLNYKSNRKFSLLDSAIDHIDTCKFLLTKQSVAAFEDGSSQRALNSAAGIGSYELCVLLIDKGAVASNVDKYGRGPINRLVWNIKSDSAVSSEVRLRIAEFLVSNGADINIEDKMDENRRPIEVSKINKDKVLYDYLLSLQKSN